MLARFFPQSFVKSNFLSFHLIELTSDCLEAEEEAVGSLFLVHTRSKMLELSFPSKNLKRKKPFNLKKVFFIPSLKNGSKCNNLGEMQFWLWWWSNDRQSWLKSWVQLLSQKCSREIAILVNVFGVRVLRSIMNKISAPMSACLH